MDECEWTRYGRVAKISIEKGIHKEYYRKILNEKYIQEGRSDIEKGRDYKYYCGAVYKSDIKCIERLIKSFNDVYSEKYVDFDMRKSTYSYEYKMKLNDPGFMNNKGEMLVLNPNVSKVSIRLSNARCYQKIYKDKGRTYQLQMPAFFLQAMAYSLHKEQEVEGESNGVIFGFYSFANRYSVAQSKILSAKILFGATDYPHYLESYYSLTKEISSNDFE